MRMRSITYRRIMPYERLRNISHGLELNITTLEKEVCDFSNLIYQYGENSNCEGIKTLADLSKEWNRLCEEIEHLNNEEEGAIDEIRQELDRCKMIVDDTEKMETEFEDFLIKQNLLESEEHEEEQLLIHNQNPAHGKKSSCERRLLKNLPPQKLEPDTPIDTTFLIARDRDMPFLPTPESSHGNQGFQDTICDFRS